jgi:hypothetical protein
MGAAQGTEGVTVLRDVVCEHAHSSPGSVVENSCASRPCQGLHDPAPAHRLADTVLHPKLRVGQRGRDHARVAVRVPHRDLAVVVLAHDARKRRNRVRPIGLKNELCGTQRLGRCHRSANRCSRRCHASCTLGGNMNREHGPCSEPSKCKSNRPSGRPHALQVMRATFRRSFVGRCPSCAGRPRTQRAPS